MVDFFSDDFGQPASGGVSRNLGLITFGLLSRLDLAGHFRRIENVMNILFVPELDTLSLFTFSAVMKVSPISVPLSKGS